MLTCFDTDFFSGHSVYRVKWFNVFPLYNSVKSTELFWTFGRVMISGKGFVNFHVTGLTNIFSITQNHKLVRFFSKLTDSWYCSKILTWVIYLYKKIADYQWLTRELKATRRRAMLLASTELCTWNVPNNMSNLGLESWSVYPTEAGCTTLHVSTKINVYISF